MAERILNEGATGPATRDGAARGNEPIAAAFPVRDVLGVGVHAATLAEVVARCERAIDRGERILLGVVNAAKLVHMRSDAVLRDSVVSADLVLADGMSVVWASRFLGAPLPERVTGIDLFEHLVASAARRGDSIYLLGAKPEVLARTAAALEARHPGLRIAGTRDGYFRDDESAAVADAIRASGAAMLFVGMSSPKKEIFLARHGAALGVAVCHGVGGSFDVVAGVTQRAPLAWQRSGLEWLYRLLQEPRRMWRRYLVTNTAFVALVLRARLARALGR
ncbi:MAG: WecB/TagA/CpsF family glycosyltransferase [Myxococcota bacterium]|nr:WecB/TagA/CpsF family glycosyltransferase [Myxococcales bacterium]